jgi:hypothetical protein
MTPSTLRVALLLGAVALIAGSGESEASRSKQVRYAGIHSVPKGKGGGLCHIEAAHVHVYAPDVAVQYRVHEGQQVFVGDPVAYGWDGDRHSYYGHHPIHVNVIVGAEVPDEEYCYLDGPHYHAFEPPPEVTADFKLEGGAYFYVGTPPPVYIEQRPTLVKINAVYEPIVYERPVITVTPPQMWIGVRYPARVARPAVVAPAPSGRVRGGGAAVVGVDVHLPVVEIRPPSVQIGVGIGVGVGVSGGGGHRHHKHKKHKKHRGHR